MDQTSNSGRPRSSRSCAIVLMAFGVLALPAYAEPACGLYQYKAKITEVYDGDSVTADVDLGFHTWIHDEKFRLLDIEAPEVRGKDKEKGIVSRDALRKRILGRELIICTVADGRGIDKREKFGRYLVKIYDGDVLINDWMVKSGFAIPYE